MHELCLLCEADVWSNKGIVEMIKAKDLLCGNCRRKMLRCNQVFVWNEIKVHIAYVYDDFFASLLFQYKSGDSKLASIFFYDTKQEIRKYRRSKLLIAPSGRVKTKERGFIPMELALKTYGTKVLNPFNKVSDYEQKKSSRRQNLAQHIELSMKLEKAYKYILIDDVATSGNTLLACTELLHEQGINNIEIYLLSATISFIEKLNKISSKNNSKKRNVIEE